MLYPLIGIQTCPLASHPHHKELGCTHDEFMEMLQVTVYMGGGPSLMTAAKALQAYEAFATPKATA